jgi:hypothetical protein
MATTPTGKEKLMKRRIGITVLTAAVASMAFAGTAAADSVTLSPSSVDFGDQKVGTTSAAKPVTLSVPCLYVLDLGQYGGKSCSAPGRIEAVNANGEFAQTNDCVLPIYNASTSGEVVSCTFLVTFTPSQTGSREGALSLTSHGFEDAYTTALSGTGVAAQVEQPEKPAGGDKKGADGSQGTAGVLKKKCKKAKKKKAARAAKKCKRKPRK